jgi:hypothetical protein
MRTVPIGRLEVACTDGGLYIHNLLIRRYRPNLGSDASLGPASGPARLFAFATESAVH